MKAIAGSDIEVGMTISLAPGGEPFEVKRIDDRDASGDRGFRYMYGPARVVVVSVSNYWYAQVES